jgi:hypothetical protein
LKRGYYAKTIAGLSDNHHASFWKQRKDWPVEGTNDEDEGRFLLGKGCAERSQNMLQLRVSMAKPQVLLSGGLAAVDWKIAFGRADHSPT